MRPKTGPAIQNEARACHQLAICLPRNNTERFPVKSPNGPDSQFGSKILPGRADCRVTVLARVLQLGYKLRLDRLIEAALPAHFSDAIKAFARATLRSSTKTSRSRMSMRLSDWSRDNAYRELASSQSLSSADTAAFARTVDQLAGLVSPKKNLILVARPNTAHFFDMMLPFFRGYRIQRVSHRRPSLEHLSGRLSKDDIVWFEWGSSIPMIRLFAKSEAFKILRIHDNELLNDFELLKSTQLDDVNAFVFVNRQASLDFNRLTKYKFSTRVFVVPHPAPAFRGTSKCDGIAPRILMSAVNLTPRKGIIRALGLFRTVLDECPDAQLTLRLGATDDREHLAMVLDTIKDLGLQKNVLLKLRQLPGSGGAPGPLAEIHQKISYFDDLKSHSFVWSTSYREAFHYFIAEGVNSGCAPLVLDWDWGFAKEIWGPCSVTSEDEFVVRTLNLLHSSDSFRSYLGAAQSWLQSKNGPSVVEAKLKKAIPRLSEDQDADGKPLILLMGHNALFYSKIRRGGEHSGLEIAKALRARGFEVVSLVVTTLRGQQTGYNHTPHGVEITVPRQLVSSLFDEIVRVMNPRVALASDISARALWQQLCSHQIPYILFTRWWRLVDEGPYQNLESSPPRSRNAERIAIHKNAALNVVNADHVGRVLRRYFDVPTLTAYVPVRRPPKLVQRIVRTSRCRVVVVNPEKFPGADEVLRGVIQNLPTAIRLTTIGPKRMELPGAKHLFSQSGPYWKWLIKFDIALFPFQDEPCGTGRVVQECHFLGIPILASKLGGLPEHVPDEHLISDYANPEAWRARIADVIANYSFHSNSVLQLSEQYDAERELKKITDAVEELANGNSKSPADGGFAAIGEIRLALTF